MGIGTLSEKSLHAALKQHLAQPGDEFEVKLDGYFIDVYRHGKDKDGLTQLHTVAEAAAEYAVPPLLIEIQTRNLGKMKRKLAKLLDNGHRIELCHPIAARKWIIRQDKDGNELQRRRSPKRGKLHDIFKEMVYIPHLITEPNLAIRVLLTEQHEIWKDDGQGSWRRKKWSIADNILIAVQDDVRLDTPQDYLNFIPKSVADPFTNGDLKQLTTYDAKRAQQVTYTLREAGLIEEIGKRGRSKEYRRRAKSEWDF